MVSSPLEGLIGNIMATRREANTKSVSRQVNFLKRVRSLVPQIARTTLASRDWSLNSCSPANQIRSSDTSCRELISNDLPTSWSCRPLIQSWLSIRELLIHSTAYDSPRRLYIWLRSFGFEDLNALGWEASVVFIWYPSKVCSGKVWFLVFLLLQNVHKGFLDNCRLVTQPEVQTIIIVGKNLWKGAFPLLLCLYHSNIVDIVKNFLFM